ncbi:BCCT family transporter [Alteromonadaceae bacterium M269]|nr:BCCT family transporter [Alteromonadaceae bacterium M269]
MLKNRTNGFNPNVFFPASIGIIALLIFAAVAPEHANRLFQQIQDSIVINGSWFYVLSVAVILVLVVYLGASRYGDIKLGRDHDEPEYSRLTWLSMLFAAGMGIGLMFFGVAEPVMHYLSPPTEQANTVEAAKEAMKMTFFHWGFHAWAIYAVVALILAYFAYRHDLPLTLRSALYPLIGDRIYGWSGHWVDIFAVVSTVFGVATSLGFGATQVNSGFNHLFGLNIGLTEQLSIMFVVTLLAMLSVASGLDKGIRRLSELNMILAVALLTLVLILGPTVFLMQAFVQNTGAYLSDMVRNTFNLFAYERSDWIGGWTIFYWGWWLAWAPFVGLFIARISRGRTIREFVLGVLMIPTAFTLMWMTFFGNSAIDLILNKEVSEIATAVNNDAAVALFIFIEQLPAAQIISILATLMIVVFFVTSCDSGAMVVNMLCSNGDNDTAIWQRVYWAAGVGVVAAILLMAGGLNGLQTMTIASALPFSIVLLISMIGLIKALRVEAYKKESLQTNLTLQQQHAEKESWKERLTNIISFPNRGAVSYFLETTVKSAFDEVIHTLDENQIKAKFEQDDESIVLTVFHGDEHDFIYGVYRRQHQQPEFALPNVESIDNNDEHSYYRAEVHLSEGGQDYDVMGWSKLALINDVIDQYQRHQHFLHLLR